MRNHAYYSLMWMEPQEPQKPCLSSVPILSLTVCERATYLMCDYVRKNCHAATCSFLSSPLPSDSLFHSVYLARPHIWNDQSCIFPNVSFTKWHFEFISQFCVTVLQVVKTKTKKQKRRVILIVLNVLSCSQNMPWNIVLHFMI